MSFAPENEYIKYGMIGEIPQSMVPPSTADFEAGIDDVERKAQVFLDMFMVSPELAQVYGPLTFEEANTNVGPRSEVEEAALRELINLPGIREGVRRARMLGKLKGV